MIVATLIATHVIAAGCADDASDVDELCGIVMTVSGAIDTEFNLTRSDGCASDATQTRAGLLYGGGTATPYSIFVSIGEFAPEQTGEFPARVSIERVEDGHEWRTPIAGCTLQIDENSPTRVNGQRQYELEARGSCDQPAVDIKGATVRVGTFELTGTVPEY